MIDSTHWAPRQLARLGRALRQLVFPGRCAACHAQIAATQPDWLLCPDCLERLAPDAWSGCARCGGPVPPADVVSPDRCPHCRHFSLRFDAVVALGGYHAGLRHIVLRMKRPSHYALSVAMGRLLAERRARRLSELEADLIVPIPMFWRRRFLRGTNNPEIVANCLAQTLRIPVRRNALSRRVNTLPQADLPPTRRFENVRGAFRVRHPEVMKNARVLLVDDVLTTGATCSEAAKVLKQAGAAAVAVAVVARADDRH